MHYSTALTRIWRATSRNSRFVRCRCRLSDHSSSTLFSTKATDSQRKKIWSRNTDASLYHGRSRPFESKKLYRLEEETVAKQITRIKRTRQTALAKYTKPKHQPLGPPFSLFITCLPGLESLLLKEIEYLYNSWQNNNHTFDSPETKRIIPGGVKLIVPTLTHLYILRLYLGTASHIYVRLNDDIDKTQIDSPSAQIPPLFRARGFPELERKLKDLMVAQDWSKWLGFINVSSKWKGAKSKLPRWNLQVHVTTSKSKLIHTKAVEERVRRCIGEVLGLELENIDLNNNADSEGKTTIRLLVRIERDIVQMSLDATAEPMHMRGYRKNPYKAPLREDLAFGLLMASGLNPNWNLQPLQPLLGETSLTNPESSSESKVHLFDPCCGSGTIAIEGAAILEGLPPGRNKSAPLQGTMFCNDNLWEDMKTKALSVAALGRKSAKQHNVRVTANDIDVNAIAATKVNAEQAGVLKFIDVTNGNFIKHDLFASSKSKCTESTLLVVANPPFGQRLSGAFNVYKKLARSILSMPRQKNSIRYAMICNDPRPMRETGLQLDISFSTKSGGLSVAAMAGEMHKQDT